MPRLTSDHPLGRGTGAARIPTWLCGALAAAGVQGLGWGVAAIIAPAFFFARFGLAAPNYPQLVQLVGVFVALLGAATIVASRDPLRHWPIVAVGLAAKVIVPVGVLREWMQGGIPTRAFAAVLANDVIWWVPFTMLLWRAARAYAAGEVPRSPLRFSPRDAMARALSNDGVSLLELSNEKPQLVVFLRHGGCTFCKEALDDLRKQRRGIESTGTGIVLVHMGMPEAGDAMLERSGGGLESVAVISDPLRQLYQSFALEQGSFGALFGPRVIWRGLAATLHGHFLGPMEGDGLQLPGVFVVSKGAIVRAYRHKTAADRPDYVALAGGVCSVSSDSAA